MAEGRIRCTRQEGVAIVTLDRPAKRNALHAPMWDALHDLGTRLAEDTPQAVVITGAEGHFSAGMDLSMGNPLFVELAQALQQGDDAALRGLVLRLKAAVDAFATLPCPVVAAVEGACAGGGLEVALTADLIVAGEEAFFSLPELQVGLAPDVGGTVRLARRVGRSRATEMILTGRRLTAAEALAWGLANRTVPQGQALPAALELAARIRRSAPAATAAVLPLLRSLAGMSDGEAFAAETDAGVHTLLAGEALEGAAAFLEKRAPRWVTEGEG